jgi:hypothetical protein
MEGTAPSFCSFDLWFLFPLIFHHHFRFLFVPLGSPCYFSCATVPVGVLFWFQFFGLLSPVSVWLLSQRIGVSQHDFIHRRSVSMASLTQFLPLPVCSLVEFTDQFFLPRLIFSLRDKPPEILVCCWSGQSVSWAAPGSSCPGLAPASVFPASNQI